MIGVETLGVVAVFAMVTSYALEPRHPVYIAIFSGACAIAALYAYLIGSYPFVVAEGVWSVIAARRWIKAQYGFRMVATARGDGYPSC